MLKRKQLATLTQTLLILCLLFLPYAQVFGQEAKSVSPAKTSPGNKQLKEVYYVNKFYEERMYNDGTKTTVYHVYALNQEIAQIEDFYDANGNKVNSVTTYIYANHLGSPEVTTDKDGKIKDTFNYKPFGVQTDGNKTDSPVTRQFTGKELDETNLNYFEARYYDANTGRFNQQDPANLKIGNKESFENEYKRPIREHLSNPQNLNGYSYTTNNPVKNKDSSGEIVDAVVDVAFVTYDAVNVVGSAGHFIGSLFSGNGQKAADAASEFLDSLIDLGVDSAATLIPFVPAGLTKVDDIAKIATNTKTFDAVAQQLKMLEGIENSKVINTIKAVFKTSDTIPGGTMGALRSEIMTGNKTKNKIHIDKAKNVVNNIINLFKSETLNSTEIKRLQGIKDSLDSLIKKFNP